VIVEDTGPGMSASTLEGIFEAFNQGDAAAARRGGTGLGLTISRNLARLMGGDVAVRSTVNKGSTFRLRIPAARVARPPETLPAGTTGSGVDVTVAAGGRPVQESNDTAASGSQAPLRALIADDSEDIRTFLQIYVHRLGLDVSLAENGRQALELALETQPDVVLLDVQMPEMSGSEAVHALRRAGYTKSVVALTAGSGEQLERELRSAGFNAVIFKPVTGDELTDTLTRLIELPRASGRAARTPR
jgi:two-component system, sensor histidine kinase